MPSKRYKVQSDLLWEQYAAKEIDKQTLMLQLNQLKSKELGYYSGYSDSTINSVDQGILDYELDKRKEERLNSLTPQQKYQKEIPNTIKEYREESKHYRNIH